MDESGTTAHSIRAVCRRYHLSRAHTARGRRSLLDTLKVRFAECGLALSPQKTKIVYCQDTNRPGNGHPVTSFDFLGFTFRPRLAKWPNGKYGVSFLPAASPRALKSIRKSVRDWGLQRRSDKSLDDLARMFSPYIRGWVNYYSHFYKTALYPTLNRIDAHLLRWARRKFKSLRQRPRQARAWLTRVKQRSPKLFPHWQFRHQNGRMLGAV